jgi:hypothetical protein
MKWRRLTINSRLSYAVCALSTLKKLKSVNLSKRILPASKVRYLLRSHLRLAWLRLPCDLGLLCQWRLQLHPLRPPILPLPPTRRPINPHFPGPRLLLGLLQLPAVLLLALHPPGQAPLRLSMAAVLPQRCFDPNPLTRRKNVFISINVGFPLSLLLT